MILLGFAKLFSSLPATERKADLFTTHTLLYVSYGSGAGVEFQNFQLTHPADDTAPVI